ncbi:MAG: beta-propeller domain-containing protein, partial [Actinomycetota bacterium]|nr:beta-propeller domain-containing protein [Actinomycetota bacterium]
MRTSRTVPAKAFAGLLAFALGTAACTGSGTPGTSGGVTDLDGDELTLTSGLQTVGDCDALLGRLTEEGVERVGPYGFGQGGPVIMEDMLTAESSGGAERNTAVAEAGAADGAAAPAEGGDFTGTNVQEAGVDEPDLVKTDGTRMVVTAGGKLRILDVSGATPTLVRTVELPADQWATDLFLIGDRVLLTTSGWTEVAFSSRDAMPRWGGTPTTRIIEVDLSTGTIGRILEFEGSQLSAREIDGTIRFVLSASMGQFPFLFPSNPEAEESAKMANQDLLRKSTIDQWLPSYRLLEDGNVVEQGRLVGCERFHLPGEFSGFGTVAVLTVDADAGLDPVDALDVLTDGQTVYASSSRLTVATQRWPEYANDGTLIRDESFSAGLHSFDISDPSTAASTGSGTVRGHLLSQYSMSEYEGYLRVATTDGSPWGSSETSKSFVTVFEERDGALNQVGQVGGLGKTEQIFAVRFLGPQAFVVTFRQTDPLYSVDLADPTNPKVVGELKIPGYSAYLHPVGDGTLIGVGQDANEQGSTLGAQISVFDVKDPANPLRLSQLALGANSYSAVVGDPRAFNWLADDRLALVPISWWGSDEDTQTGDSGSSAVLVKVNEDGSLTELGDIGHPTTEQCEIGIVEERTEGGDGETSASSTG